MNRPRFAVAAVAFGAAAVVTIGARGQAVEVGRAHTFIAGSPPGDARTDRGGGARAGYAHELLPAGRLVVEWRAALGFALRRAPVIGPEGEIDVVSADGDVVTLGSDGSEHTRLATGAGDPGPLALLAAGDLVFVDDGGEAVGVRGGHTTFRSRFGRAGAVGPAPLPLEDGGVIVATEREVALLDAAGGERAHTTFVEPIRAPLVSAGGQVLAVTASGAVWAWRPGAFSPELVGAFGGPVDGAVALAGQETLVAALPAQGLVVAVDLARHTSSVVTATSEGLWLGPPSITDRFIFVPLLTTVAEMVVEIDRAGNEVSRSLLGGRAAKAATSDAGATPLALPPHTPPLIDADGTFLFATPSGDIGAASDIRGPNASVDILADVCGPPGPPRAPRADLAPDPVVVGLVSARAGIVVAACANGTVLAIRGETGTRSLRPL